MPATAPPPTDLRQEYQIITAAASPADFSAPFPVSRDDLSGLTQERTRSALADLLERALEGLGGGGDGLGGWRTGDGEDGGFDAVEDPTAQSSSRAHLRALVRRIRAAGAGAGAGAGAVPAPPEHSPERERADADAELAAAALAGLVLRSSPETGLGGARADLQARVEAFGTNSIADKKLDSFLKLCWEAVQDFVLIMLIVLGVITIIVETTVGVEEGENCGTCWIEGTAILLAVVIVVLITASIDYRKQFAFVRLTKNLEATNTKSVIRAGEQISVIDADIVVGDILSVNAHNLASIPADCVLLGPESGTPLKMDESPLTGESKMITKRPGDVILSGTTASQGSGKMVVIAVGIGSVAGKIRARIYESEDHDEAEGMEGDDESPLFTKLTLIAKQIGIAGIVAAVLAFVVSCIIGIGIQKDSPRAIVDYIILSITVLAVAVPEGLPLAVTLALAFSSKQMMKEQNLVKHLDACETMGCATTICTDKTGKCWAQEALGYATLSYAKLRTDTFLTPFGYCIL